MYEVKMIELSPFRLFSKGYQLEVSGQGKFSYSIFSNIKPTTARILVLPKVKLLPEDHVTRPSLELLIYHIRSRLEFFVYHIRSRLEYLVYQIQSRLGFHIANDLD